MLPSDIVEVNVASKLFDFVFRYPARLAHIDGFVQDVYKAVREYDCQMEIYTYIRGGTFSDIANGRVSVSMQFLLYEDTWAPDMNIKWYCPLNPLHIWTVAKITVTQS